MTIPPRKTERILVLMSPDEVKEIDDWAFARRIRSRGEAVRQLTRLGLDAPPSSPPDCS